MLVVAIVAAAACENTALTAKCIMFCRKTSRHYSQADTTGSGMVPQWTFVDSETTEAPLATDPSGILSLRNARQKCKKLCPVGLAERRELPKAKEGFHCVNRLKR